MWRWVLPWVCRAKAFPWWQRGALGPPRGVQRPGMAPLPLPPRPSASVKPPPAAPPAPLRSHPQAARALFHVLCFLHFTSSDE